MTDKPTVTPLTDKPFVPRVSAQSRAYPKQVTADRDAAYLRELAPLIDPDNGAMSSTFRRIADRLDAARTDSLDCQKPHLSDDFAGITNNEIAARAGSATLLREELRALSAAATPGPWQVAMHPYRTEDVEFIERASPWTVIVSSSGAHCEDVEPPCDPADAAFIAALVNWYRLLTEDTE